MTVEIISSQWLADNLLDPKIKIIEVSSKKENEAGYFKKHIPGAINFWWKDLCWDDTDRQFVTPLQLADRRRRPLCASRRAPFGLPQLVATGT